MANFSNIIRITTSDTFTRASNDAIRSITFQNGWNDRRLSDFIIDFISRNGTRNIFALVRDVRHDVISYDAALDAVPSRFRGGRYDRVRAEVTDSVRGAIFNAFIRFFDRNSTAIIDRQAEAVSEMEAQIAELQACMAAMQARNESLEDAALGLLSAPGVDETSEDYQRAVEVLS